MFFFQSIDTQVQRQQSRGIGKHLDWDGLTTFKDPVQQQIEKLETKYEEKLEAVKHQLAQLQNLIAHTASACNGEVMCSHDFSKIEEVGFASDLQINRGSYMSARVLLNLSNELGKIDKMRSLPSILSLFRNEFNKFNNTRA